MRQIGGVVGRWTGPDGLIDWHPCMAHEGRRSWWSQTSPKPLPALTQAPRAVLNITETHCAEPLIKCAVCGEPIRELFDGDHKFWSHIKGTKACRGTYGVATPALKKWTERFSLQGFVLAYHSLKAGMKGETQRELADVIASYEGGAELLKQQP